MTEISPSNKWIGARIRSVRIARNKTQAELGEVLGVTHATVSDIELGKNRVTIKDIGVIAKYFGMPIYEFIPLDINFNKETTMKSDLVHITNDSPVARKATVTIGGVTIPWIELNINMKVDNLTTIEITTRADLVDVEALQKDTELIIKELK